MKTREDVVRNYIAAYNDFDVNKMLLDLDEAVQFENISNGVVDMKLVGLAAFKEQAAQATKLFSKRTQTIKSITHRGDETEIEIDYHAVLAVDLANGLRKGDELNLQGRSIFKFSGDKIVAISDIS
jgi:hypothetical protein